MLPQRSRRSGASSLDFLLHPPSGFTDVHLATPRPYLFPARKDQANTYSNLVKEAREFHYEVSKLTTEECVELCPVLRKEILMGGLFEPGAMDLDVNALHQGYISGLKKNGGALIVNSPVTAMSYASDRWNILSNEQSYQARIVVNAAGAWGDVVGKLAGAAPIGLKPLRRQFLPSMRSLMPSRTRGHLFTILRPILF